MTIERLERRALGSERVEQLRDLADRKVVLESQGQKQAVGGGQLCQAGPQGDVEVAPSQLLIGASARLG